MSGAAKMKAKVDALGMQAACLARDIEECTFFGAIGEGGEFTGEQVKAHAQYELERSLAALRDLRRTMDNVTEEKRAGLKRVCPEYQKKSAA